MGANDEINEMRQNWDELSQRAEEDRRADRERAERSRMAREEEAARAAEQQRQAQLAAMSSEPIVLIARRYLRWARKNRVPTMEKFPGEWLLHMISEVHSNDYIMDPDSTSRTNIGRGGGPTTVYGYLCINRWGNLKSHGIYPKVNAYGRLNMRKVEESILKQVRDEHTRRLRLGLPKPTDWPPRR